MAEIARLHATVRGDVQGVGFRWFVRRLAAELDLEGWVANRPDGSVEVLAEGRRQDLQRLLDALRQGPRGASVEGIDSDFEAAAGDLRGFEIRP